MKIALGQINPTVGDFGGNAAKIIDFSHRAQSAGAGLILFPELSVCGYPPRDLVERASFVQHNRETLDRIAAETRGMAVICGLVTPAQAESGKSVMNSAALLKDGRVAHALQIGGKIGHYVEPRIVCVECARRVHAPTGIAGGIG